MEELIIRIGPYWGYIFSYCPVDEALWVCIDPVENSVVAALGNTPVRRMRKRVKRDIMTPEYEFPEWNH